MFVISLIFVVVGVTPFQLNVSHFAFYRKQKFSVLSFINYGFCMPPDMKWRKLPNAGEIYSLKWHFALQNCVKNS